MLTSAPPPDAFAALADPRRREILDLLADGERRVNDVVDSLGVAQPQVSKHLSTLRRAGLVQVRRDGRSRIYSVNAEGVRPVYDWIKAYERLWTHQLGRIKARAERAASGGTGRGRNSDT